MMFGLEKVKRIHLQEFCLLESLNYIKKVMYFC